MNWKFWSKKQITEEQIDVEPPKTPRVWLVTLEKVCGNSILLEEIAESYSTFKQTNNDKYKIIFWRGIYQLYPEIKQAYNVKVTQTRSGYTITEILETDEK